MLRIVIQKIGYGFFVMCGVIVVVFILFQGIGDPVKQILGQTSDTTTINNIKKDLLLNEPKWMQLVNYANDVSPIAFHTNKAIESKQLKGFFIPIMQTNFAIKIPYLRRSYQSKKQVTTILSEALPGTFILAVSAIVFATFFGIILGTVAAYKKGTWWDASAIFISILGISVPSFFVAIVFAYCFGFLLHNFTGLEMTGSLFEYGINGRYLQVKNLILPTLALGIRPLSIIAQLTRSAMLDVLEKDYIRTAYAKGLTSINVMRNHALRNALNPVVTSITGWFAELLAGAFFIEYIFGWKGIGKITVDALEKLDFPVVMGSVLLTACCFVIVNIFADILYRIIDPRVSL